jgi:hypothetical protein
MKTWTVLSIACAAPVALGGCKDDAPQHKAAGGELLPRSVADDMPPYDTIRSQSPLENPEAAATLSEGAQDAPVAGGTEAAETAEEAAREATAAEAAEPAPAAE